MDEKFSTLVVTSDRLKIVRLYKKSLVLYL